MQNEHHIALIDEADSVLIDESRSPLGISGSIKHPYSFLNYVMKLLKISQKMMWKLMKKEKMFYL